MRSGMRRRREVLQVDIVEQLVGELTFKLHEEMLQPREENL